MSSDSVDARAKFIVKGYDHSTESVDTMLSDLNDHTSKAKLDNHTAAANSR